VPRTSEIAPSECSDVEPSDVAPFAAATSPLPLNTIVRPTAAAAEESESMATEPAEPVSAHPSPAGRPISLGGPGVEGAADSSLVGSLPWGTPAVRQARAVMYSILMLMFAGPGPRLAHASLSRQHAVMYRFRRID